MEMDSIMVVSKQAKNLGELLQEKQEPFVLDVYLSERGCITGRNSVGSQDVGKKQKRKRTGRWSKLLRALCDRKAVTRGCADGKCIGDRVCRINNTREAAELDKFSSASSTTVYNSCSDTEPGDERPNLFRDVHVLSEQVSSYSRQSDDTKEAEIKEVVAEPNKLWRSQECIRLQSNTGAETSVKQFDDKSWQKDLQVFSVWQEMNESTCRLNPPNKITEESLSSIPTFDIHFDSKRSILGQSNQLSGLNTPPDYLNSKWVLQQTKQLAFDCVKEVIETYARKDKAGRSNNSVTGPEEIGKIICERIVGWGRAKGNEMSIGELIYLDYMNTVEEWDDCFQQKMHISLELGDALIDGITNEIVDEMICH